jgi:16S rRNA processing protein RimM
VPEAADAWVWLARIRRPQGRKGEVFAEILTDFPEKFAERKQLWLLSSQEATSASRVPRLLAADAPTKSGSAAGARSAGLVARAATPAPRQVELQNHWLHKGGVVLHFAQVDSISAAELLAGMIVAIPRAGRAALSHDEVYVGDLIGCLLVDVAGADPVSVGEIEDVDRSGGAAPLLVVRGTKVEVLVPFVKSFLRKIDLEAKRVEMELPEGLADLNPPGASDGGE